MAVGDPEEGHLKHRVVSEPLRGIDALLPFGIWMCHGLFFSMRWFC